MDFINSESLALVAGTATTLVALVISILQIRQKKRVEERLIESLARSKKISEEVFQAWESISENSQDLDQSYRKVLKLMRSRMRRMSKEDRLEFLQGLDQSSRLGKARYMEKLVFMLEKERGERHGSPRAD